MRSLIFATFIAISAAMGSEAAAQTTYPLQCRAGGNMTMNVAGQTTGGGTEITIGFDRATSTRGLPAGSCSWLDRTLNSAEPRSIRLVVRARMNVDFRPRPGDSAGDRAGAYVYPGSGADVAVAQSIINVLKAGGYFQVQAYNPGRAPMVASSFRETAAR